MQYCNNNKNQDQLLSGRRMEVEAVHYLAVTLRRSCGKSTRRRRRRRRRIKEKEDKGAMAVKRTLVRSTFVVIRRMVSVIWRESTRCGCRAFRRGKEIRPFSAISPKYST